ncbi:MAG: ATP-binding protein [Candidatus Margulisbacteria bacterium]|nr:ATP-binding protein [Candidatus Margulisiibacteriota bacterium]
MKRDIIKELRAWKKQKEQYPLLIRGARQVGKSFLVESFAKENFSNSVIVNFELQPHLKNCFSTLDPVEIINKIQIILGVEISAENTLLFLDEVQECPPAIMALRYFKEKMPRLHVIGAGSLLEFALRSPDFKMPVGRVQFLYLEPLSFGEFLDAFGSQPLRKHLSEIKIGKPLEPAIHARAIELLRLYLILGGMPAVLKEYFASRDLMACQNLQNAILQAFRSDFGKYARTSQHKYLLKVFDAAPRQVGQRIKYVNIDPEIKSRDLKNALELLSFAGIIKPVYCSAASGVPLGAQTNEAKFKLNFLDTGLMQNACGLQKQITLENNVMQINSGSVAEQFVGQEFRAYSNRYQPSQLFFWARDKIGGQAEIDFVISEGADICPVEVKAGKTGTLKSLKIFIKEKKAKFGIRISQENLSYFDQVLSVPLYMIEQIPRLIRSIG